MDKPCDLAVYLARNEPNPASAVWSIHRALVELATFDWGDKRIGYDFHEMRQCCECEQWKSDGTVREQEDGGDLFCDDCWANMPEPEVDGISDRERI